MRLLLVLHSKAPIITTIIHNTKAAQKKYIERIYNSHVMNFCINSWESCDYWPQATVLNGSAWLCAVFFSLSCHPLNCLHLTIFTVCLCYLELEKNKVCLFIPNSTREQTGSGTEEAMEEFLGCQTSSPCAHAAAALSFQLVLNHTIVQLRLEVGNISSFLCLAADDVPSLTAAKTQASSAHNTLFITSRSLCWDHTNVFAIS